MIIDDPTRASAVADLVGPVACVEPETASGPHRYELRKNLRSFPLIPGKHHGGNGRCEGGCDAAASRHHPSEAARHGLQPEICVHQAIASASIWQCTHLREGIPEAHGLIDTPRLE